jgi:hypothetical protein
LIGFGDVAPFPFVWLENPREHGGNPRSDPWIVHVIGSGYNDTGSASAYAAADLNGDGRMDVVTGQAGGGNPVPMGALWWWEAPADRRSGVWIKHVIDPTYSASQKINVADMDGNGTTDIVTAEQEQAPQRRVSIFYNDGRGNFSQTVLSNGSGHNVTLGDAEADGDLDILSSAHGYFGAPHPVELYRNRKTRR